MGFLDAFKKILSSGEYSQFEDILGKAVRELRARNIANWNLKAKDLQEPTNAIVKLTDKDKVRFILFSQKLIDYAGGKPYNGGDPEQLKASVASLLMGHLLKTKFILEEEDVVNLVEGFMKYRRGHWTNFSGWPLSSLITAVERNFQDGLPGKVKASIGSLKDALERLDESKETIKLIEKISALLFKTEAGKETVKPTLFLGDDRLKEYANDIIRQQPEDEKITWYKLMQLAQKASGSKPSAKYLDQAKTLIQSLPADKFKRTVTDWFDYIVKLKEIVHQHTSAYGQYNTYEFLSPPNLDVIKGFVWMCSHFHDTATLQVIAALCERSFRKIPGQGPTAASTGNACLFTLYNSKGLEGIAHLSRLKLRIRQNSTQTLIEKYLQEAASNEGITVSEIEDLAVDDFDLKDHKREYEVDGYKAVLSIQGVGDVQVDWFKPDGTSLKAAPSVIKEKHAEKLKKIKGTAKQIETALTAQRDRIDRMFRLQREMSWEYFTKHYFAHGLLSYLTKDIIWKFRKGDASHACIFLHGQWTTLQSEHIEPDMSTVVSLWHPALAAVAEIRSWRELLMEEQIRQPVKQAFREVYLLTDAEVNTRTYSNRMAAHILKQHQFNSLAKVRGWKYSLLGAYDDGRYNEGAELILPESKLRAEFWVNEVNADDAFNDTGIWNYVSTDQVRFVNPEASVPVELVSVPPVIFSEVMRDVDLFVGVASVGNDPTWSDNGGIPAYRNYWEAYSFGELTEIAKTRKEILENLVPRLKIASVASIKDKFLVVKGKKRTYKIHIGSTNILMEPNDQYLCIVPDRSKKDTTGNVFLPFEGDAALSVILSKAFLLADDDTITDSTILTQINRK